MSNAEANQNTKCTGHYGNEPCGWIGKRAEIRDNGCCPKCGAGHLVIDLPHRSAVKCNVCVWAGWSTELRSDGSCPLCKGLVHEIFAREAVTSQVLDRPSWPETWMSVAKTISRRSYDPRLKVGAIVVTSDNTQMLSGGYNGNYSGGPHEHESTEPGQSGFIHAENNALLKLDFNHPKPKIMYVTHSPCRMCAKLIINSGILRVVYDVAYRDPAGLDLLLGAGLQVFSLEQAIERASRRDP